jgi:hypothetical protein
MCLFSPLARRVAEVIRPLFGLAAQIVLRKADLG